MDLDLWIYLNLKTNLFYYLLSCRQIRKYLNKLYYRLQLTDCLQKDSGTYTDTAGNIITWATVTSGSNAGVTVTVQEPDGTTTSYTLPYQDNQ